MVIDATTWLTLPILTIVGTNLCSKSQWSPGIADRSPTGFGWGIGAPTGRLPACAPTLVEKEAIPAATRTSRVRAVAREIWQQVGL